MGYGVYGAVHCVSLQWTVRLIESSWCGLIGGFDGVCLVDMGVSNGVCGFAGTAVTVITRYCIYIYLMCCVVMQA